MEFKHAYYEHPKMDVILMDVKGVLCDSDTGGENPDPGGWN